LAPARNDGCAESAPAAVKNTSKAQSRDNRQKRQNIEANNGKAYATEAKQKYYRPAMFTYPAVIIKALNK
jgi:hypothetical protein